MTDIIIINMLTPPNGRPRRIPDSTVLDIAEQPNVKYSVNLPSLNKLTRVSQCS